MKGKSSILQQVKGTQDTLVIDGILALGVGLLALAIAMVFIFAVLPQAEFDVSLDAVAGVGATAEPWNLLGGQFGGDSEAGAADAFQLSIVSGWPTAEAIQSP